MKKYFNTALLNPLFISACLLVATASIAQTSSKDKELISDAQAGVKDFVHTDAAMQNLFSKAYGYVIFPNVGKGAIGVGGASGGGILYEGGKVVGKAQMTQITIGFQAGGQAYREVIFFQTKETLDRFKANKFEFSAQVSAIAAKSGAAAAGKYTDGVMIFTQQKGGLMYEASVGGQKFKYTAF